MKRVSLVPFVSSLILACALCTWTVTEAQSPERLRVAQAEPTSSNSMMAVEASRDMQRVTLSEVEDILLRYFEQNLEQNLDPDVFKDHLKEGLQYYANNLKRALNEPQVESNLAKVYTLAKQGDNLNAKSLLRKIRDSLDSGTPRRGQGPLGDQKDGEGEEARIYLDGSDAGYTISQLVKMEGMPVYSAEDIAPYNTKEDCIVGIWDTVPGKTGGVFNLTTFITKHPGGSMAIELKCGKIVRNWSKQHAHASNVNVREEYRVGLLEGSYEEREANRHEEYHMTYHMNELSANSSEEGAVFGDMLGVVTLNNTLFEGIEVDGDAFSLQDKSLDTQGGFVIWISDALQEELQDKKEWKGFHNTEFTSLLEGGRVLFEDDRSWVDSATETVQPVDLEKFKGYTVKGRKDNTVVVPKLNRKTRDRVIATNGHAKHCHFTMRSDTLDYVKNDQHNSDRSYYSLKQHTYDNWRSLGTSEGPLVDSCACTRKAPKDNGCKEMECFVLAINTGVQCDNCGGRCTKCWKEGACSVETWQTWQYFKNHFSEHSDLPDPVAACAKCLEAEYTLQLTLSSLL